MDFLKKLGIENENFGACSGPKGWLHTKNEGLINSINPTDNKIISSVYHSSIDDYNKIVKLSLEAQREWQKVPAPERGQLVREMGNALREHKDSLGSLVSFEMGKIKQEGDGEVQERLILQILQ